MSARPRIKETRKAKQARAKTRAKVHTKVRASPRTKMDERLLEGLRIVKASFAEMKGHNNGFPRHDAGLAMAAEKLGVTRQAVACWKARVPHLHVLAIARMTGVPPYVQRPDLFEDPNEVPNLGN